MKIKFNIKTILMLILVATLSLCLFACGNPDDEDTKVKEPSTEGTTGGEKTPKDDPSTDSPIKTSTDMMEYAPKTAYDEAVKIMFTAEEIKTGVPDTFHITIKFSEDKEHISSIYALKYKEAISGKDGTPIVRKFTRKTSSSIPICKFLAGKGVVNDSPYRVECASDNGSFAFAKSKIIKYKAVADAFIEKKNIDENVLMSIVAVREKDGKKVCNINIVTTTTEYGNNIVFDTAVTDFSSEGLAEAIRNDQFTIADEPHATTEKKYADFVLDKNAADKEFPQV